ncbi:hypothetical protein [Microtetraspora malaysiensis]|uniref:Uncharacterized protein n=1 Tax=Microtetraspora malaysiensis TaxID=161358 RepID=A0ABW6SZG9_9ACTN
MVASRCWPAVRSAVSAPLPETGDLDTGPVPGQRGQIRRDLGGVGAAHQDLVLAYLSS